MALSIPATQDLADQNLATLEAALGQTSPLNDKAFLRVLAVLEALGFTGLYKMGVERAKQNLAMTATGADLDLLGAEETTPRKPAVAAVLTATFPALTNTIIPVTASFTGQANGVLYNVSLSAVSVAGVATIQLTAELTGTLGNLQVGDTLNITSPIAGAESVATVTTITITGADSELDAPYRQRVLFAMRATTGGANATDHKIWAEQVAGVTRAFPYAGKPAGGGTSYPGDRTVFVESDTTINADGIATSGLLAEVRTALNTDPVTGLSRPTLGLVDANLYVQAIARTAFQVAITGFVYPSGQQATIQGQISDALTAYFLALNPYVEGVDLPQDKNDVITQPSVSEVIQGVLSSTGSSASSIAITVGSTGYSTYTLAPGEKAKAGAITYV